MAGMIASGVVQVETLAVDGMRLQAAANRGTFRRSERLAMLERAALEVVQRLRAEVEEDPVAAERRTTARRLAVAEDRARRLEKPAGRRPRSSASARSRGRSSGARGNARTIRRREPRPPIQRRGS
jgi:hypothetical protein